MTVAASAEPPFPRVGVTGDLTGDEPVPTQQLQRDCQRGVRGAAELRKRTVPGSSRTPTDPFPIPEQQVWVNIWRVSNASISSIVAFRIDTWCVAGILHAGKRHGGTRSVILTPDSCRTNHALRTGSPER